MFHLILTSLANQGLSEPWKRVCDSITNRNDGKQGVTQSQQGHYIRYILYFKYVTLIVDEEKQKSQPRLGQKKELKAVLSVTRVLFVYHITSTSCITVARLSRKVTFPAWGTLRYSMDNPLSCVRKNIKNPNTINKRHLLINSSCKNYSVYP